jgi:hypothetical protein
MSKEIVSADLRMDLMTRRRKMHLQDIGKRENNYHCNLINRASITSKDRRQAKENAAGKAEQVQPPSTLLT